MQRGFHDHVFRCRRTSGIKARRTTMTRPAQSSGPYRPMPCRSHTRLAELSRIRWGSASHASCTRAALPDHGPIIILFLFCCHGCAMNNMPLEEEDDEGPGRQGSAVRSCRIGWRRTNHVISTGIKRASIGTARQAYGARRRSLQPRGSRGTDLDPTLKSATPLAVEAHRAASSQ